VSGDECAFVHGYGFSKAEIDAGKPAVPTQRRCLFDADFLTGEGTKRLWEECSVVIALHPDEATSPVALEAIRHGKPFAIVPCCVYRTQFPNRLTPNLKPVVSYEELCDHLEELGPRIKREQLDIPGRNTVLYWTEEDAVPSLVRRDLFAKKGSGKKAKNRLQEHQFHSGGSKPLYSTSDVKPPFLAEVSVQAEGEEVARVYRGLEGHKRKKDAEESAAEVALAEMGVVEGEEDEEEEGGGADDGFMIHPVTMCRKT